MECKHKWVRSGYGLDMVCTTCGRAAMQLAIPVSTQPIEMPVMRESIVVPIYDGEKTIRVSLYKDELENQLKRSMGLGIRVGRQV